MQSTQRKTVRQRIEQVLQPFESQALLTRPRAIAWDFAEIQTQEKPTLSDEDSKWLKERALTVIHCAASIRFQKDDQSHEPYRTNVSGTQNLLKLCEQLTLTGFHHVSTAYVGRHRLGEAVMEIPAAMPEQAGNDYERSKIQAEQLVSANPRLGVKTIHRPSIVIGDSKTGFTSTFHGFYAPLQIGWQYAKTFGFSDQAGQWFRQQLGLGQNDRKNLVNVDWVSEGIVNCVEQQSDNEASSNAIRILHWTNPQPVACETIQSAIVDAIERATEQQRTIDQPQTEGTQVAIHEPPSAAQFREQMQVYESYFQSDPPFDRQQASAVASRLICPAIDYEMLSRLSDWAIQANFGWPKRQLPELPHQEIIDAMERLEWLENGSLNNITRIQLLGRGASEPLYVSFGQDECRRVGSTTILGGAWRVPLSVIASCVTGATDPKRSVSQGDWLMEGKTANQGLDCAQIWINYIRRIVS
jgi:nucleoside-diphosphate-sugar epimerase